MGLFILLTPGFPENEEDTSCLPAFQQFALKVKELYPKQEFVIVALQYPFIRKKYLWNGIPVIAIGGANKPGLQRLMSWIKTVRELFKLNSAKKIDGILSLWLSECSLVAKYFSFLFGVKHYMWLIGQDAKLNNQYIKRIKAKGDKIIAMSDFLQEEYYKNHKQMPFMVAENGINPSIFPTLNIHKRSIDILGVGSLIALKNYNQFIEIINKIRTDIPNVKVVIAGSGIEEQTLKEKVKSLNLQNSISFVGQVSHTEIFQLMNDSKLFLHTSIYEGNSTVLMEALYSGCQVVSTCALSKKPVENLFISQVPDIISEKIKELLLNSSSQQKRVVFNTMDQSVSRIMELFLKKQ